MNNGHNDIDGLHNKRSEVTSDESSSGRNASSGGAVESQLANLSSNTSLKPTDGGSIEIQPPAANFAPPTHSVHGISGDEDGSDAKRRSANKRSLPDTSNTIHDSSQAPPMKKAAVVTSAEQKRNREKQRRSELNETLDDLSELVFQIDPSLRSGRAEDVGTDDACTTSSGRKNTITNRTELIQCTVRLLKRIHAQNQRKDELIADLKGSQQQLSSHLGRQGSVSAPSQGQPISSNTSNPNTSTIGGSSADFSSRVDPGQVTFTQRMVPSIGSLNQASVGHIPFGSSSGAIPGLLFPGAFQGLLTGNTSIPGFQAPPSQYLFGPMGQQQQQQQQQQGRPSHFQHLGMSSPMTSGDSQPFQTVADAPCQAPPDRNRSGVQRKIEEVKVQVME